MKRYCVFVFVCIGIGGSKRERAAHGLDGIGNEPRAQITMSNREARKDTNIDFFANTHD